MSAIGGSIESVSLNGRVFAVAADAEAEIKIGGFENEIQANGNGTARQVKTRVPHSVTGVTLEMDDSRGDHEFVQALADSPDYFDLGVSKVSGITYAGTSQFTGEMQSSTQSATMAANFGGPGKLTQV